MASVSRIEMCLVEKRRCFKNHSLDHMCISLAEPKNIVSDFMYTKHAVRKFIMYNERVQLRSQRSTGSVRPLRSKHRYRKQRKNNGLGLILAMLRATSIERAPCSSVNFTAVVLLKISGSADAQVWLTPAHTVSITGYRHVPR